jgi:hypothetical protein
MSLDPQKRIDNWNTGYDTTAIKAKVDKKRDEMLARVTAVTPLAAAVELRCKQVLDMEGVSIITVPFYMAFAKEVWRLSRMDLTGETGSIECSVAIAKWVARGLAQSVLETLRDSIFKISRPTVPTP